MNKPRRANRDLIKAMNRNLILHIVRGQGPLSRTQLVEISGLSLGAVSQITNDLLSTNWLHEVGESDYTGGRRQIMLRLNPHAGYVLGLKLMEERIVCALTDLETTVLAYVETPLAVDHTPERVSAVLCKTVEQTIRQAQIPREKVLGVGVGLAGVVDCTAGIVRYSPFFKWRDTPLVKLLERDLSLPVHVENDVNTLTITEQLFGPGHDVANFAVVTVGRGVGMGMVLHHQLYRGDTGGVGELGHITVENDGPLCDCGKRGCLEAVASDPAVIRDLEALGCGTHTLDQIVEQAQQGHAVFQEALARSGHFLGIGLATIINLLCPSLIILSGEGVVAGDFRLKPMFDAMRQHTMDGLMDHVQLVIKPTDDQTWARGAAGLVVGKLFESPLLRIS